MSLRLSVRLSVCLCICLSVCLAGIAAAVAISDGVTVRKVSVAKVQAILRALDMPLHAEDIRDETLLSARQAVPA